MNVLSFCFIITVDNVELVGGMSNSPYFQLNLINGWESSGHLIYAYRFSFHRVVHDPIENTAPFFQKVICAHEKRLILRLTTLLSVTVVPMLFGYNERFEIAAFAEQTHCAHGKAFRCRSSLVSPRPTSGLIENRHISNGSSDGRPLCLLYEDFWSSLSQIPYTVNGRATVINFGSRSIHGKTKRVCFGTTGGSTLQRRSVFRATQLRRAGHDCFQTVNGPLKRTVLCG